MNSETSSDGWQRVSDGEYYKKNFGYGWEGHISLAFDDKYKFGLGHKRTLVLKNTFCGSLDEAKSAADAQWANLVAAMEQPVLARLAEADPDPAFAPKPRTVNSIPVSLRYAGRPMPMPEPMPKPEPTPDCPLSAAAQIVSDLCAENESVLLGIEKGWVWRCGSCSRVLPEYDAPGGESLFGERVCVDCWGARRWRCECGWRCKFGPRACECPECGEQMKEVEA